MHQNEERLRPIMAAARQYGVGVPGGAEALVHFRGLLEAALREEGLGHSIAVLDLDLVNAFPSLEWDSIRAAVDEAVP